VALLLPGRNIKNNTNYKKHHAGESNPGKRIQAINIDCPRMGIYCVNIIKVPEN